MPMLYSPKDFLEQLNVEKRFFNNYFNSFTDTGSRMDEVIFEEFKGRGNSELI